MAEHIVKVEDSEAIAPKIKLVDGVVLLSMKFRSNGPDNPSALNNFAIDYVHHELDEVSLEITTALDEILATNIAFADEETLQVTRKALLGLVNKLDVALKFKTVSG